MVLNSWINRWMIVFVSAAICIGCVDSSGEEGYPDELDGTVDALASDSTIDPFDGGGDMLPQPGPEWTRVESGTAENLRAVACRSGGIWAVGDNGTILHSSGGQSFVAQESSEKPDFSSVAFINSLEGVVVGGARILETTDGGETWDPSWFCAVIAMSVYHKVIMVEQGVGYAIGQSNLDEGTYKYRIPQGWNCFASRKWPGDTLYTGAYTGPDSGFMTGDTGGDVFKTTDASTWETVSTGFSNVFHDMIFETSLTGWIVGEDGIVLRTDDEGESWRSLSAATDATLLSIAYKEGGIVVAVGDEGTVIESTDGGESFTAAASGVENSLNGVCFSEDRAVIVGDDGLILQKGF